MNYTRSEIDEAVRIVSAYKQHLYLNNPKKINTVPYSVRYANSSSFNSSIDNICDISNVSGSIGENSSYYSISSTSSNLPLYLEPITQEDNDNLAMKKNIVSWMVRYNHSSIANLFRKIADRRYLSDEKVRMEVGNGEKYRTLTEDTPYKWNTVFKKVYLQDGLNFCLTDKAAAYYDNYIRYK